MSQSNQAQNSFAIAIIADYTKPRPETNGSNDIKFLIKFSSLKKFKEGSEILLLIEKPY